MSIPTSAASPMVLRRRAIWRWHRRPSIGSSPASRWATHQTISLPAWRTEVANRRMLPVPGVLQDIQATIDCAGEAASGQGRSGGLLLGRIADLARRVSAREHCGCRAVLRWRHDHHRRDRAHPPAAQCWRILRIQDHVDSCWRVSRPSSSPPRSHTAPVRCQAWL